MNENAGEKAQPKISVTEELAGGVILLTWSIASAIVPGNCLRSSKYNALGYPAGAFFVMVVLTPTGGCLLAAGLARVVEGTRT